MLKATASYGFLDTTFFFYAICWWNISRRKPKLMIFPFCLYFLSLYVWFINNYSRLFLTTIHPCMRYMFRFYIFLRGMKTFVPLNTLNRRCITFDLIFVKMKKKDTKFEKFCKPYYCCWKRDNTNLSWHFLKLERKFNK